MGNGGDLLALHSKQTRYDLAESTSARPRNQRLRAYPQQPNLGRQFDMLGDHATILTRMNYR